MKWFVLSLLLVCSGCHVAFGVGSGIRKHNEPQELHTIPHKVAKQH